MINLVIFQNKNKKKIIGIRKKKIKSLKKRNEINWIQLISKILP